MKKFWKGLGIVFLLFLCISGIFLYQQRETLEALEHGLETSEETILEELETEEAVLLEIVETLSEVSLRQPTAEEQEAFQAGLMTPEELTERLISSPSTLPPLPETGGTTETPTETAPTQEMPSMSEAEKEERLSYLLAQVYVLRESYVKELNLLQKEAEKEYRTLSANQRSKKAMIEFAARYTKRALALEKNCNAQMDAILTEIEQLQGNDTLSGKIADVYAHEKSLKKAQYMRKLEEKGWI